MKSSARLEGSTMNAGRNRVLLSEFFELADFEDPETGQVIVQAAMLDVLNNARMRLGRPVRIMKAYVGLTEAEGLRDATAAAHAIGAAVVLAAPGEAYEDQLVEILSRDARVSVRRGYGSVLVLLGDVTSTALSGA
jgi:hypothetical protein